MYRSLLALCLLAGCTVGVRRDWGATPPNEIIFDDRCGLQGYFDDVLISKEQPPKMISSDEMEKGEAGRSQGGRSTFAFEPGFSLAQLRRVLAENWKPLPEAVMKAESLELEVYWTEKVANRWVVTDRTAELSFKVNEKKKTYALAFHPCLTAFLFGQNYYEHRREMVGLPPLPAIDFSHDSPTQPAE